jgi:rubredoxin
VPGIPREQIEGALESADPWADLSLAFQCPACGRDGEAGFDVASYLWEEVDVSARQLLNEVHLLAQAYGWSEAEILALSPARRSAYLARVAP